MISPIFVFFIGIGGRMKDSPVCFVVQNGASNFTAKYWDSVSRAARGARLLHSRNCSWVSWSGIVLSAVAGARRMQFPFASGSRRSQANRIADAGTRAAQIATWSSDNRSSANISAISGSFVTQCAISAVVACFRASRRSIRSPWFMLW